MSLADLKIKSFYDSDEDDILNDFYIPVLRESIEYRRLTGYFSSTSLYIAARGIRGLLENKGIMKIISGAVLRRKDVEAIKEGKENPSKIIERLAISDFDRIENELIKNHISALGWLVANNKLEIKVALVKDTQGVPIDVETLEKKGIFHQKVGVFIDKGRNMIAFSGSINETAMGWSENIEELNVFRSWAEGENKYFKNQYDKFEKYWIGKKFKVEIIDIPEAVKRKLIKMAPNKYEKLNLERIPKSQEKKKIELTPWPHQIEAIKSLKINSYKGIFKMATGTGKTYTALLCVLQYFKDIKKYGNKVLIVVPQHNLVKQWIEDLNEFFSSEDFILPYDSKTSAEKKQFARSIWRSKFSLTESCNVFLIITIGSIKNFSPIKTILPDFVIGDEVHTYGTENNINTLKNYLTSVKYRLGLSATPERYYDFEGTERIKDFFGPNVFEYGIKAAQKDGILSKYYYYPYVVELTLEEENELEEITNKIRKEAAINFNDELSEEEDHLSKYAKRLIIKRAKILKNAERKLIALKKILENEKSKIKQCIIYCLERKQLDKAQKVFDELGIDTYIKYHSQIENRDDALSLFKNNNCNYILSINCLDQGVNIPTCSSLIMLSSSGNPREYIQRRGRVLRNPKNTIKPLVRIFDVFAFPISPKEIYKEMIITQLIRGWAFIKSSETPEAKIEFQNILDSYNISSEEIEEIIGEL